MQLEYLEIKAQHMFEVETSVVKFPDYQSGSVTDNFKLGFYAYASLLTNKSLRRRVFAAVMIMVFQQCKYLRHMKLVETNILKGLALTPSCTTQL